MNMSPLKIKIIRPYDPALDTPEPKAHIVAKAKGKAKPVDELDDFLRTKGHNIPKAQPASPAPPSSGYFGGVMQPKPDSNQYFDYPSNNPKTPTKHYTVWVQWDAKLHGLMSCDCLGWLIKKNGLHKCAHTRQTAAIYPNLTMVDCRERPKK